MACQQGRGGQLEGFGGAKGVDSQEPAGDLRISSCGSTSAHAADSVLSRQMPFRSVRTAHPRVPAEPELMRMT